MSQRQIRIFAIVLASIMVLALVAGVVAPLLAGGLTDALSHLGASGPGAATHHAWDGTADGTRIDHVLVDGAWQVLAARIDRTRPGGRLPSDHWPVVADVAVRGQPERAGSRADPARA